MADNLKLIRDRTAYWNAKGLTGEAYYKALMSDSELPGTFTPGEVADITGFTINTLKSRRQRGMAPTFLKLSRREVSYPRADLFAWLLSRYVPRPDKGRAVDEYTRVQAA